MGVPGPVEGIGGWRPGGELTLLLGFLLLAAFLAGKVAEGVRLPRITGYLLLGWIVGPDLLGFPDRPHLEEFRIVEDLAISLIAMSAGGELRIGALRRRWRQIVGITATEMTAVFLTLSLAVVAVSGWFPLTAGMPTARVTVAMIFGSVAIANSPAVAIAVIKETGARGPVSSTILAVTVLKDVMVVVLFTGALSVARVLEGAAERAPGVGWTLGWEVGGSLAMGMVAGWMISLYMVRFKGYSVLFILGAALANTLLATFFHLEALLISISAGFFVRNLGAGDARRFMRAVEANSIPFYALFFSLAGAGIQLEGLKHVGGYVLLFVGLRAVAVFLGTRLGARMTDSPVEIQRYAWTGFISQAGVALGMVMLAARAFPTWGAELQIILVAMVAMHELVGPILFLSGLRRAGEIGVGGRARRVAPDDHGGWVGEAFPRG